MKGNALTLAVSPALATCLSRMPPFVFFYDFIFERAVAMQRHRAMTSS